MYASNPKEDIKFIAVSNLSIDDAFQISLKEGIKKTKSIVKDSLKKKIPNQLIALACEGFVINYLDSYSDFNSSVKHNCIFFYDSEGDESFICFDILISFINDNSASFLASFRSEMNAGDVSV